MALPSRESFRSERASNRKHRRGGTGLSSLRGSALDLKQFDLEEQRCVWRDHAAGATSAVTQRGRNDQRALASDFHRGNAFVPAGDHPALSDRKFERLVAVDRAVELL